MVFPSFDRCDYEKVNKCETMVFLKSLPFDEEQRPWRTLHVGGAKCCRWP